MRVSLSPTSLHVAPRPPPEPPPEGIASQAVPITLGSHPSFTQPWQARWAQGSRVPPPFHAPLRSARRRLRRRRRRARARVEARVVALLFAAVADWLDGGRRCAATWRAKWVRRGNGPGTVPRPRWPARAVDLLAGACRWRRVAWGRLGGCGGWRWGLGWRGGWGATACGRWACRFGCAVGAGLLVGAAASRSRHRLILLLLLMWGCSVVEAADGRGEGGAAAAYALPFSVFFWNARRWRVRCKAGEEGRSSAQKLGWLLERLAELRPAVFCVLEVGGTAREFNSGLRNVLRAIGYDAHLRFDTQGNGIVCGVHREQAALVGGVRALGQRVVGLRVFHKQSRTTHYIAGLHGFQPGERGTEGRGEGRGGEREDIETQIDAARTWVGEAGLVVGDFNHVAHTSWRAGGRDLCGGDQVLRRWTGLEAEEAAGVAGRFVLAIEGARWTRWNTALGWWASPSSIIDHAIAVGAEIGRWGGFELFWAEGEAIDGTGVVISDHAAVMVSFTQMPTLALQKRPLPLCDKGCDMKELAAGVAARFEDGSVTRRLLAQAESQASAGARASHFVYGVVAEGAGVRRRLQSGQGRGGPLLPFGRRICPVGLLIRSISGLLLFCMRAASGDDG